MRDFLSSRNGAEERAVGVGAPGRRRTGQVPEDADRAVVRLLLPVRRQPPGARLHRLQAQIRVSDRR